MIYGDRIRLRRLEKADLPHYVAWLNDPEVRAGLGMYLPMSQVEEDRWFERMLERPPEEHPNAIEIQDPNNPETWVHVGSAGLFRFDWRARSAEFGIMIGDKNYWNRGYGTEVTRLILQHGFETFNLHRIYLRVFATNPRARRAYEKVGYTLEGTLRQAEYREGVYIDVHIMSVLRPEYAAKIENRESRIENRESKNPETHA